MKNQLKHSYYEEALSYMQNAEELLERAQPVDGYYEDKKYVKSAAGIAYAGIEKAAKWYAKLNGVELKGKNVEMIKDGLRKINRKVLNEFVSLYSELHIAMYYEDNTRIKFVQRSFSDARQFMEHLKPYSQMAEY